MRDYEILDLPRPDDFDRWVSSRNTRAERSVSRNYVSEGTIGYADLDEYGRWDTVAEYGQVWYPSRVSVGWALFSIVLILTGNLAGLMTGEWKTTARRTFNLNLAGVAVLLIAVVMMGAANYSAS